MNTSIGNYETIDINTMFFIAIVGLFIVVWMIIKTTMEEEVVTKDTHEEVECKADGEEVECEAEGVVVGHCCGEHPPCHHDHSDYMKHPPERDAQYFSLKRDRHPSERK